MCCCSGLYRRCNAVVHRFCFFSSSTGDMTENALPMSHTCFNQLVLPNYSTVEILLKQLKRAVKHGIAEGFHLT
jgi:hypothetical protein